MAKASYTPISQQPFYAFSLYSSTSTSSVKFHSVHWAQYSGLLRSPISTWLTDSQDQLWLHLRHTHGSQLQGSCLLDHNFASLIHLPARTFPLLESIAILACQPLLWRQSSPSKYKMPLNPPRMIPEFHIYGKTLFVNHSEILAQWSTIFSLPSYLQPHQASTSSWQLPSGSFAQNVLSRV